MNPNTNQSKASESRPEPRKSTIHRFPGGSPLTDGHRADDTLSRAPPAPIKAVVIYTCPMHSQIRQNAPGNCPICGMTLEPVKATAEVGENHELVDMTRRFWIGLVLALPVFVLEMGGHIPALGLHDLVPPQISIWIQFALSTPVVLWAGFLPNKLKPY